MSKALSSNPRRKLRTREKSETKLKIKPQPKSLNQIEVR